MNYKIEIWQYHSIIDTYENEDINKVLKWYKSNWEYVYEHGNCAFSLYKNGEILTFEEKCKLGFY